MRDKDLNVISGAINEIDEQTTLRVYEKIYFLRMMEKKMIEAQKSNRIIGQLFLSSGEEAVSAAVSERLAKYQYFAQHRSEDWYLSLGADPQQLVDELLGKETGCSGGRGKQIGIQYHSDGIDMYGDNLLIGECVPRGCGAALGNGRPTVCVFGDGAAEEDYVLESLGFATTYKLPVLFLCMDNDLSILTPINKRRSWSINDVARGFGLAEYDMADDPWSIIKFLDSEDFKLPMLLNVRVCREYYHVGIGQDGPREWERNEIVRNELIDRFNLETVCNLEKKVEERVERLWA